MGHGFERGPKIFEVHGFTRFFVFSKIKILEKMFFTLSKGLKVPRPSCFCYYLLNRTLFCENLLICYL